VDSALAAELLPPSEVDLAQEMTQQILALRSLQANLPIIRAEDEMTRDLLDASRSKE
jgi:flagellar hook protein FlgE